MTRTEINITQVSNNMKKYIILAVIIALITGAAVISGTRETTKTQFVLNTVSTIKIKGNNSGAVDKAFARISEIESHMSSYITTSDIVTGTLNADTSYVISKGLDYGNISEGKFDITVKPLCDLWDINGDNPRVPAQQEISAVLPLINYQKVFFYNGKLVMEEGMALELGAIAKGYAADEACRILRENGVEDGFVDLGGNVVAMGTKTVGIRNPISKNNGDYFGTIKLTDSAVATSGGYERYFEQDGKRYHHIFDPQTGYPVETDILSASVICEKAIDADCWSTILFSAGVEKAQEYISRYSLNAILADVNKNVYVFGNVNFTPEQSSGFKVVK